MYYQDRKINKKVKKILFYHYFSAIMDFIFIFLRVDLEIFYQYLYVCQFLKQLNIYCGSYYAFNFWSVDYESVFYQNLKSRYLLNRTS